MSSQMYYQGLPMISSAACSHPAARPIQVAAAPSHQSTGQQKPRQQTGVIRRPSLSFLTAEQAEFLRTVAREVTALPRPKWVKILADHIQAPKAAVDDFFVRINYDPSGAGLNLGPHILTRCNGRAVRVRPEFGDYCASQELTDDDFAALVTLVIARRRCEAPRAQA